MIDEEMTEDGHSTVTKEVNCELLGGSVSLLQQVPGLDNLNLNLKYYTVASQEPDYAMLRPRLAGSCPV
eukprot:6035286-Lingulodinium_polyedra.AAC.1